MRSSSSSSRKLKPTPLQRPHLQMVSPLLGENTEELPLKKKEKGRGRDYLHRFWKWRPLFFYQQFFLIKAILIFAFLWLFSGTLVFLIEHHQGNQKDFQNWWDGLWWGIETVTTTGYGDKFPISLWGKVVAGLTMCLGLLSTGIITGSIASWLVDLKLKEGRGQIDLSHKSNHLVICGWRREMDKVVEEILHFNDHIRPQDIVIIAPISLETLEAFRSHEKLSKVFVLRGDFYSIDLLKAASVGMAEKVLILSDWSRSNQTMLEIDAKTIMTALTIEKVAPHVYITAELMDRKFESYLRLANCDEIIHSREYARILLANSTASTGLSQIIYDLLNKETPTHITTEVIPEEFIGQSFRQVSQHFFSSKAAITIGLLENTGNVHSMKGEYIEKAQKNADLADILQELKQIKSLSTNIPVLNPAKDYPIKKFSRAVIIGHRSTKGA